MKIYTEVVFNWDDASGELVEESSKSYDYAGPLCLADPASWGIFALQAAGTLWGMSQQQKQSVFTEGKYRQTAEQLRTFAGEKYGLATEQAKGVRSAGERTARQVENQGKWKLLYMQDAGKRRVGEMVAGIGSSGSVIGRSSRRAILSQGRANALSMYLQAAETKRVAAEARYGADTQAYYMMRSADVNRRNYMASASSWDQQASYLSASRMPQMVGTLLTGTADIVKTQTYFKPEERIWSSLGTKSTSIQNKQSLSPIPYKGIYKILEGY